MLTEKDRSRIVAEQTAAFLEDGFAGLDLSGSPDLVPLVDQPFSSSDDRGFNNVQVPGSNGLREFANNPDNDTLARISQETGNPDLAEQVIDETEGAVAEQFVRSHPSYFVCEENYNLIRDHLEEKHLAFTAENLHTVFTALSRRGQLEMQPGTAKSLSESEQLHCISLCKNGQLEDAVSQYLDYSLPGAEEHWSDTTDFLSDPDSLSVRNQACKFVWFHSRPVQDTPAFHDYEKVYFRHRPIRTIADYDDCYCAFQANEKDVLRDQIIHEDTQPQTRQDLEELSDDQVGRLTEATRKMRARQILKAWKRA